MAGTERVTFYDIAPELRFALATKLAQAAWEKKKCLVVRCQGDAEARALDEHLWVFRDDAFVPHEVADGRPLADPEARVLIIARDVMPPDHTFAREILIQLTPSELAFASTFASVIDLVDHSDEAHLAASRARFKAWVDRGVKPAMKDRV